jgi:ankyrin repeat protein
MIKRLFFLFVVALIIVPQVQGAEAGAGVRLEELMDAVNRGEGVATVQGVLERVPEEHGQRTEFMSRADENGCTALHHAAFTAQMPVIQYLVDMYPATFSVHIEYHDEIRGYRTDFVGKKNNAGDTALHIAAREGHLAVVRFLYKARERNPRIPLLEKNEEGASPLLLAARKDNREVVVYFIDKLLRRAELEAQEAAVGGDRLSGHDIIREDIVANLLREEGLSGDMIAFLTAF